MSRIKCPVIRYDLLAIFLLFASSSFAKVLPPQTKGLGYGFVNTANVNDTLELIFDNGAASGFSDRHVENFITLAVDYDCPTLVSDANVEVRLQVKYYDISGTLITTEYDTLLVNHSYTMPYSKDRAIVVHEGAYTIWFKIESIKVDASLVSSLPVDMYLESRIVIERFFDFTAAASTPIDSSMVSIDSVSVDCDSLGSTDGLYVTWPLVVEAEEYDLEWTFINDYDSISTFRPDSTLRINFRNNATRISTTINQFTIPMLFDHGYVAIRVRAVGRSAVDFDVPIFGPWSLTDKHRVDSLFMAGATPFHVVNPHESGMNWQVTSTFAEDGKHKEVLSYFDGTLRNRQTVTRLSTSGVAVVGETIYDFHGRPAIQILPAPVVSNMCDSIPRSTIKFYKDFNSELGTTFKSYSAWNFDEDLDSITMCQVSTPGISLSSGAGRYYSPMNSYLVGENAFIPNSAVHLGEEVSEAAYPFTQVEYTPDNTGRIRRQGGVGYEFQLDSDHETKYLYGVPHQIQLDRLFGSEAGYYHHYKKNAVRDPNGQVSVSYLDMTDKVIATALVGPNPENLLGIPSSELSLDTLTSALINPGTENGGSNQISGESIEFAYTLVVPYESDYTFEYGLEIEPLTTDCIEEFCMHCVYDLSMSITNDCGEVIWPTSSDSLDAITGHFDIEDSVIVFTTSCDTDTFSYDHSFTINNLEFGEYTIHKILSINTAARDYYLEQFLTNPGDTCMMDSTTFIEQYLNEINVDECAIEYGCAECLSELGDRDAYIASGPYDFETNALVYDWRYEECMTLCDPVSLCKAGYTMMISDVSKNGQYGEYYVIGSDGLTYVLPEAFHLSVFNEENDLPKNVSSATANWRYPQLVLNNSIYPYYVDIDGVRSTIPVVYNGTYQPLIVDTNLVYTNSAGDLYTFPENLTNVQSFLSAWQPSWARSLVMYHPEYCYYESCETYNKRQALTDYITSDQFDDLLLQTNTMSDAVAFGLVDLTSGDYTPTNWFLNAPSGAWPFESGTDIPYDPFVVWGDGAGEPYSGDGSPYYYGTQLMDSFNDFDGSASGFSMTAFATYSVISSVDPSNPVLSSTNPVDWEDAFGTSVGADPTDARDQMWSMLKSVYLGAKRQLQNERDNNYAIYSCAGYNGCFQSSDLGDFTEEFTSLEDSVLLASQPCSPSNRVFYGVKIPRFPTVTQTITQNSDESICDNELNLQNLVNYLISQNLVLSDTLLMDTIPTFVQVLANQDIFDPPYDSSTYWNATTIGDTLIIQWLDSSLVEYCEFKLIGNSLFTSWDSLYYITDLQFVDEHEFEFTAYYHVDDSIISNIDLFGWTDCIGPCPDTTSGVGCEINQLAIDLIALFNALIDSSEFYTELDLDVYLFPDYAEYLTPTIMAEFPYSDMTDMTFANNGAVIVIHGGGTDEIVIAFHHGYDSVFVSMTEIVSANCRTWYDGRWTTAFYVVADGVNTIVYGDGDGSTQRDWFCNCIQNPSPCCSGPGYEEFFHVKSFVEEFISDALDYLSPYSDPSYFSSVIGDYVPSEDYAYSMTHTSVTIGGSTYNAERVRLDGEYCDLNIYMYPDANLTTFQLPNLLSVNATNFSVDGEPDDDGFYRSFSFTLGGYNFYGTWCVPMKECEFDSPCGTIPPIENFTFTTEDPCEELITSVAIQNAMYEYEQWYNGVVNDFISSYNAHCLNSVNEQLTATFEDKEYHYTLYYYDLSGNLVRTVPPAGVKPLEISSSFDPLAQNIEEDRTTGERRIYSFHNLATTYTYNSLNQLVHQAIPDHDKMDIWETSLTNGLAEECQVNEIQLLNGAQGYLGGELAISGLTNGRGHLYETFDSGQSWQRMNGLVAADLKKIEMINASLGYAIGNDGVFLKTSDGGANWDMLVTYTAFGSVLPGDFMDFAINMNYGSTPNSSNHGLLLVGEDGLLFKITYVSGQETFTRCTTINITSHEAASVIPTFGADWDFQSVEYAYTKFVVWVTFPNGNNGEPFSLPFSTNANNGWFTTGTLTFEAETFIRPSHLHAISQYDYRKAYAAGVDGRLYHCTNVVDSASVAFAQWYQVPTNMRYTFEKLHFYNGKCGVAIVNEGGSSSIRALYKSVDYGQTWTKISSNESFNDFYPYHRNPECASTVVFNGVRLLAVGDDGVIARLTILEDDNNPTVGFEILNSPLPTLDFNTCWAEIVQECSIGGDFIARYFIAGDTTTTDSCAHCAALYTCFSSGYDNEVEWQEISSTNISANVVDLEIYSGNSGGLYPRLSGVLLSSMGEIHTLYIDGGAPDCSTVDSLYNVDSLLCPLHCPCDYSISTALGISATFTHLLRPEGNANGKKYVYGLTQDTPVSDSVLYDMYRFNCGLASAATYANLNVSNPAAMDEMQFYSGSAMMHTGTTSNITLVGENGFNFTLQVDTTSLTTSWIGDDRYAIRPLPIRRQEYAYQLNDNWKTNCLAIGKNGTLLIRRMTYTSADGGYVNCWNQVSTDITEDITAIDFSHASGTGSNLRNGLLGTDLGRIYKWTCNVFDTSYYTHALSTTSMSTIGLTELSTTLQDRVTGIACQNYSGVNVGYVCSNNGRIVRTPTMWSPIFVEQPTADHGFLYACLKYNSSDAILCGPNAHIDKFIGYTRVEVKNVFVPRIQDVEFINSAEGYVLSDGWTIRHTINGGATWQVVLPSTSLGLTIPSLKKLAMKEGGWSYCVGESGLGNVIKIANNTYSTGVTLPTYSNIIATNIEFDAEGTPWVIGSSSTTKSFMAYRPLDTGSWYISQDDSSAGSTFLGMHIFPSNNSIMVCGENGYVNIWANGSWGAHSNFTPSGMSSVTFHDTFFHDDLVGYIVGTNGVLMKTDRDAMILPEYEVNGLLSPLVATPWQRMRIDDNLNGQTDSTQMTLNSLAFSNRWEGIWGGNYAGSPDGYSRLILDESEIFSSRFWYDRLGRISASQNTKQYNYSDKRYSYTIYDALGRVEEAGEKQENTTGLVFKQTFGLNVEGYYNSKVINDTLRRTWLTTVVGDRYEVTHTYYDTIPQIATLPVDFEQNNLNKRVVCVSYADTLDGDSTTYNHATHYTYDIHGNIGTLVQDYPRMGSIDADDRFKRVDYVYDLISGNVKQVSYQSGRPDQFYHCYYYDSDNRIVDVYTARRGWDDADLGVLYNRSMPGDWLPYFEHDASYRYYYHGPLARVELGDIKVQGIDYAYTLQGWLKGVNSNTLVASRDIGMDAAAGINEYFAQDAFGFTLGYQSNDYSPIDTTKWVVSERFEAALLAGDNLYDARQNLWNGNIGHMVTALYAPPSSSGGGSTGARLVNGMAYHYDQLNRLRIAQGFDNLDTLNNEWNATTPLNPRYFNSFTYDANGNILTQNRADGSNVLFDNLTYHYQLDDDGMPIRNRLYHVNDSASSGLKSDDIDNMASFISTDDLINTENNYGYDLLGQLVRDSSEFIQEIFWRVDGKIRYIDRIDTCSKKELSFEYDALGNRIAKHVHNATGEWEQSTYYVRDAQGNVLSVYEHTIEDSLSLLNQKELHLYGSSRLGMIAPKENQLVGVSDPSDTGIIRLARGEKNYELTNHLGNVLSTISDQKIPEDSSGTILYFNADVVSYSDYYPFGTAISERSWIGEYRYGFNGKEINEVGVDLQKYDYGFRVYNPSLGKFLSVDPLFRGFPWNSCYAFAENDVIRCIDLDGKERYVVINKMANGLKSTTVIFLSNDGEIVNMNLKNMTSGEMLNTKDVLVVKFNKKGKMTYYSKDKLSAREKRIADSDSKETLPKAENIEWVKVGGEDGNDLIQSEQVFYDKWNKGVQNYDKGVTLGVVDLAKTVEDLSKMGNSVGNEFKEVESGDLQLSSIHVNFYSAEERDKFQSEINAILKSKFGDVKITTDINEKAAEGKGKVNINLITIANE